MYTLSTVNQLCLHYAVVTDFLFTWCFSDTFRYVEEDLTRREKESQCLLHVLIFTVMLCAIIE
jgi:hypothetical protein